FILTNKGHGSLPPGPMPLPIIGHLHLLQPLIHRSFRDFCSCYGPLIYLRLGSVPCVVASTPELARELLKTNDLTFSSRKHSLAIDHLTYSSSFAFAPYGPYWRFIKKLSTFEFLGNRALNQFLPVRRKELRQFIGVLHDKSKVCESVNVTKELLNLSSNIISQIILSLRCSGTDNEAEGVRTLVREVTQIFGEFNVSDFIWFCRNLDFQGYRKKFEDVHRRYDALLENIITNREIERKKSGGKYKVKDLLDMMLDALEDKSSEVELTREHIKALVLDFITAATDTTAAATEWALAELINNPKESKINGYTIPKNTLLFVNIWSIGRDSRRSCPGIALALLELPVTLAAMIQCFDWKVADLDGVKVKGNALVDMTERPGLTAPSSSSDIQYPTILSNLVAIIHKPPGQKRGGLSIAVLCTVFSCDLKPSRIASLEETAVMTTSYLLLFPFMIATSIVSLYHYLLSSWSLASLCFNSIDCV
ncbi:hypothetical protein D5086_024165, partial [Populus alba]